MPVRYEVWQVGGSHAQRDLFELILIDAAMKGTNAALARGLLAERHAAKPDDHWTEKTYAGLLAA